MKRSTIATVIVTVGLCPALLLATLAAQGQTPATITAQEREIALRTRRLAEQFATQARVLTIFDRQGRVVSTVGEPAIYNIAAPAFSLDRARLAVVKSDLENRSADIWVLDVATGSSVRITSSQPRERAMNPAWSPDGAQLAYLALRSGYWALYRKASNGEGDEERLYQFPGASLGLTDWSLDGRFLNLHASDLGGGALYVLPLTGDGDRKPIELLRSEFQLRGSRLSPDGRFLAYQSNQSGREEIYVRPFSPSLSEGLSTGALPWKVSDGTQPSPAFWRQDGKEIYYVAADRGLMAVEISTTPVFKFGKPRLLFRLTEAVPVNGAVASVSRDGQRIVIAVPRMPALQQITVFDRQRNALRSVGQPGRYGEPMISPDGTRVAVVRTVPQTGTDHIWTFDVASGTGSPVTNDSWSHDGPVWSPDGKQLAYNAWRGKFSSIYRKARDGRGNEEHIYQEPTAGAGMLPTAWSSDGKFIVFEDDCSSVLHVLSLGPDQKPLRKEAIDWLRDEYTVAQARFSPDARFIAYLSNEGKTTEEINSGMFEVYVRPFDPGESDVSAGGVKPVQVSTDGASGMIFWRDDGKEMYYLTPDWELMAVEVTTTPRFAAGTPRLLLKLPGKTDVRPSPSQLGNASTDGRRFVFVLNVPAGIAAR